MSFLPLHPAIVTSSSSRRLQSPTATALTKPSRPLPRIPHNPQHHQQLFLCASAARKRRFLRLCRRRPWLRRLRRRRIHAQIQQAFSATTAPPTSPTTSTTAHGVRHAFAAAVGISRCDARVPLAHRHEQFGHGENLQDHRRPSSTSSGGIDFNLLKPLRPLPARFPPRRSTQIFGQPTSTRSTRATSRWVCECDFDFFQQR